MESRPQAPRADVQRLDLMLAEHQYRHDALHPQHGRVGPLTAKGGFLILCVTGDPAFARRAAHTAEADNAHTAVIWSAEDLERLPVWGFHGALCDKAEADRITSGASSRVKALMSRLPTVVAVDGPEGAVRSLLQHLTAAAQQAAMLPP